MKCSNCESTRIAYVNATCNNKCTYEYKSNSRTDMVPNNVGLGDNSNKVQFDYCLDCGTIQGKFPIQKNGFDKIFEDTEDDRRTPQRITRDNIRDSIPSYRIWPADDDDVPF